MSSGRPPAQALDAAYRATTYRVVLPAAPIDIRIGAPTPALDDWLATQGAYCWAFVTAVNPGSRALAAAVNAQRLEALAARLRADGRRFVAGVSIADAGDWPDEAGFLVVGTAAEAARALAAEFGQNALVVGVAGQPARLLWTR